MYYIASMLLRKAGDSAGARQVDSVIDRFITDCEKDKIADNEKIAATISILEAESHNIIAVGIPYRAGGDERIVGQKLGLPEQPFTKNEVEKCELLWQRAVALADKLPDTAHIRRMTHRNLCLWYKILGMSAESDEQKEILFTLIGSTDEKYLYPTSGVCGAQLWWPQSTSKRAFAIGCGMG